MKAIIVDIDGTIADISHRLHFIGGKKKDWPAFFKAMNKDEPKQNVIDVVNVLAAVFKIILVTGRPKNYKTKTVKWLGKYGVRYDLLYMREKGDFRADEIIKKEIYEKEIKSIYEIIATIDDRQKIVNFWRKEGLTCFQVERWEE